MGVGLDVAGSLAWRPLTASVAGAGHRARGIGCEDASCVDVLDDGTLLVAVADGAGSAPRAAEGSSRAVAAAMEGLRAAVDLDAVLSGARLALEPVVAGERLGDLATTLLVVRAGQSLIETAQVGDGAVVLRRDGELEVLAADTKGEYLNETCFLTSDGWRASMRIESAPAEGVDGIAAMTDGLQLVAFDLSSGRPHAPFFSPFFSFAAGDGDVGQLAAFLGSDRVGERTDDDVTLAIASLVAPSA
ncbi:MAG TPA: PP2C family serine/threonine-protein phosphatase [Acidimicrobiales bacterium]|nr:PP2C family serine/threonine-protein phosphatase [Acidimicrobiales bacterium]